MSAQFIFQGRKSSQSPELRRQKSRSARLEDCSDGDRPDSVRSSRTPVPPRADFSLPHTYALCLMRTFFPRRSRPTVFSNSVQRHERENIFLCQGWQGEKARRGEISEGGR